MKGPRLWIAVALASLLAHAASAQGFDHSRFKRSTLASLSADLAARAADQDAHTRRKAVGDSLYDAQLPPWVVSATYTGLVRPLAPDELRYVKSSLKAVNLEWMGGLYQQAMLFQADGKNYWLPVQKQLAPYFRKELKARDAIDLYVVQPGGLRRTRGWAWLFLVEDFQKP